jgi:hypothetical protein
MYKRKHSSQVEGDVPLKIKRLRKINQFSEYLRAYRKKGTAEDSHDCIFRALKADIHPEKVLYPGCHRHITPSLFFSNVHYVDSDQKVGGIYSDPKAIDFINSNKEYPQSPQLSFSCKDYNSPLDSPESYDLLISLSADVVSAPCEQYLKPGGHLFVNDSHSDARTAYLNPRFRLVSTYDSTTGSFCGDKNILADHFHTKDGKEITQAMVNESLEKPPSRRSFKLKAENMYYLFQKNNKPTNEADC